MGLSTQRYSNKFKENISHQTLYFKSYIFLNAIVHNLKLDLFPTSPE